MKEMYQFGMTWNQQRTISRNFFPVEIENSNAQVTLDGIQVLFEEMLVLLLYMCTIYYFFRRDHFLHIVQKR